MRYDEIADLYLTNAQRRAAITKKYCSAGKWRDEVHEELIARGKALVSAMRRHDVQATLEFQCMFEMSCDSRCAPVDEDEIRSAIAEVQAIRREAAIQVKESDTRLIITTALDRMVDRLEEFLKGAS